MNITWRQIVIGGFLIAGISAAGGGRQAVEGLNQSLATSQAYASGIDQQKTRNADLKEEGRIAMEMIRTAGCTPAIGLAPKSPEDIPGRVRFIPKSLSVGQFVTIGGQSKQNFGTSKLVCSRDRQVGIVGVTGKLENPIQNSQDKMGLPQVPQDYEAEFQEILNRNAGRDKPQAVVSSAEELMAIMQSEQMTMRSSPAIAPQTQYNQIPAEPQAPSTAIDQEQPVRAQAVDPRVETPPVNPPVNPPAEPQPNYPQTQSGSNSPPVTRVDPTNQEAVLPKVKLD